MDNINAIRDWTRRRSHPSQESRRSPLDVPLFTKVMHPKHLNLMLIFNQGAHHTINDRMVSQATNHHVLTDLIGEFLLILVADGL